VESGRADNRNFNRTLKRIVSDVPVKNCAINPLGGVGEQCFMALYGGGHRFWETQTTSLDEMWGEGGSPSHFAAESSKWGYGGENYQFDIMGACIRCF